MFSETILFCHNAIIYALKKNKMVKSRHNSVKQLLKKGKKCNKKQINKNDDHKGTIIQFPKYKRKDKGDCYHMDKFTTMSDTDSSVSSLSQYAPISLPPDMKKYSWFHDYNTRHIILGFFVYKYQSPPKSFWYGRNGLISILRKDIPWTNKNTIAKVLEERLKEEL